MPTISLKSYEGTSVTVLSTELNSLASGSVSALGSTILDNTTNLDLFATFVLTVTFGSAPTAGNLLGLYIALTADGTNYDVMPATGTTLPNAAKLVGSFILETAGTTQVILIAQVALTPGKHKFQLVNSSGVALPASGSTVVAFPYNMQAA